MTHPRILAVKGTISEKFERMISTAKPYWTLRDQIMEHDFEVGFNEYAYRQDRHHSGESEAWEDFGSKWVQFEDSLEVLRKAHGSVENAFHKIKLDLLVDTDAIINQAFAILKSVTNANKPSEITVGGRKIFGFPQKYVDKDDQGRDYPHVRVKDLLWYGRNQVNHFMDDPGPAVRKLQEFKTLFKENIEEHVHWHYLTDIEKHFVPEAKISMSDEILKLLCWESFDDFERDLDVYLPR